MFTLSRQRHGLFPATQCNRGLKEYNERYSEPFGEERHDGRNNIILSRDMSLSMDSAKTRRNTNICVIGSAGSGKTHNIVTPNLLQANSNYVISDPGGYLFYNYAKYLEYMGYKVKCINLIHTDQSNHYNPFRYIRSDEDIMNLVNTLISNTTPTEAWESKGMTDFQETETMLLTALVAYLHQHTHTYHQHFSNVMRLLRTAWNDECKTVDYSHLDTIFGEIRKHDPESFAVKQYDGFRMRAKNNLSEVLISCAVRLMAFDLPDIVRLTETDDIDLETIGDEKTALFIITPESDTTFNFLTAMVHMQLFRVIYGYCETTAPFTQVVLDGEWQVIKTFRASDEAESIERAKEAREWLESAKKADIVHREDMGWYELVMGNGETAAFRGAKKEAQKALDLLQNGRVVANSERSNSGRRLPIHVQILFDEFASTGKITELEEIVATCRPHELSVVILLQSRAQAKIMCWYDWPDIIGNCDTLIYLGGGTDVETAEWISRFIGKERGGLAPYSRQDAGLCSKIRTMPEDKCIVIIRGMPARKGQKFSTNKHKNWGLAKKLGGYYFSKEKRNCLYPVAWGTAE